MVDKELTLYFYTDSTSEHEAGSPDQELLDKAAGHAAASAQWYKAVLIQETGSESTWGITTCKSGIRHSDKMAELLPNEFYRQNPHLKNKSARMCCTPSIKFLEKFDDLAIMTQQSLISTAKAFNRSKKGTSVTIPKPAAQNNTQHNPT